MSSKKGLGRGLDALLSIFDDEEDTTQAPKEEKRIERKVEPKPAPKEEKIEQKTEEKPFELPKPTFDDDAPFLFDEDDDDFYQPKTSISVSEMQTPEEIITTVTAEQILEEVNAKPEMETVDRPKEEGISLGIDELPIDYLEVNPNQPRKTFDQTALAELAESIKIHGVIQPIVVNKINDKKYMIIAGERRYRASKLIGLKSVPCVVKQYSERQVKEVSLIENLQREDLNPIEAARAIRQLMEEYNFTQDVVADRIGKSRPTVTNILRLLNLTPEVIKMIETGVLSAGHARPMITILDRNLQVKVAQTVVDKKLSVRECEKLVREVMRPKRPDDDKHTSQSAELIDFGEQLQRVFSTRVSILGNDDKGRICIDYFSKDDLDRIFDLVELIKNKKLTLEDLSNFNKH